MTASPCECGADLPPDVEPDGTATCPACGRPVTPLLELAPAPEPAPPPPPTPGPAAEPQPDAPHVPAYVARIEADAETPAAAVPAYSRAGPTCPSCGKTLPREARICTDCGIDLRTGRPLLTAQGLDESALYVRAENAVRLVSFVLPVGMYPVASEAFGTRRPYVVWALALLTLGATIWLWTAAASDPFAGRQFQLWVNPPTADQIVRAYAPPAKALTPGAVLGMDAATLLGDTGVGEPARQVYEQRKRELRGTLPDEQVPQAAYNALPDEHRAFGRFRVYQVVTYAFVHAGVLSLIVNLLFLVVFGSRVNALIGQAQTFVAYLLLAAVSAGVYAYAARGQPADPVSGASGAVMGLAGMYLVLFPVHLVHNAVWWRSGLRLGFELHLNLFAVRGFWIVLAYLVLDVAFLLLAGGDRSRIWLHVGGFGCGIVLALGLLLSRRIDARGGDALSALLGRRAWLLVGKPRPVGGGLDEGKDWP